MSEKHCFGPILDPKTGDSEAFGQSNKHFLIQMIHIMHIVEALSISQLGLSPILAPQIGEQFFRL